MGKAKNRIEAFRIYLANRGPYDEFDFLQYPKHVAKLRREIIEIAEMPGQAIQELYGDFCYYAFEHLWLAVSPAAVIDFRKWLLQAPGETNDFMDFGSPAWYELIEHNEGFSLEDFIEHEEECPCPVCEGLL